MTTINHIIIMIIIIVIIIPDPRDLTAGVQQRSYIRPIVKLRISKFGVWAKQILKRRRWTFLVHRLISERSDFGMLTQRFLVWQFLVWKMATHNDKPW